jgi:hypothetical protein
MDEVGHQAWVDPGPIMCYVPAQDQSDTVYFPVPRTGKRTTLIACIAADGSHLKSCMIIPRKTYDDDIAFFGWTREKIDIYHQSKSLIDRGIFSDWLTDIFGPELLMRREKWHYDGPAFLILGNCMPQRGDDFEDTQCLILSGNHEAWEELWHGGSIKRDSTSIVSA